MAHGFDPDARVYVGNVDFRVIDKGEIEEIFSRHGVLLEFKCFDTFCFVQYESSGTAQEAIASENGRTLGGKRLEVELARANRGQKRSRRDRGGSPEGHSYRRKRDRSPPPRDRWNSRRRREQEQIHLERPRTIVLALHSALRSYAEFVGDVFRMNGIDNVVDVVEPKKIMDQIDRAADDGVRFTCLIKRVHEQHGGIVSFRCVDEAGKSRGVADTYINDVINFIHTDFGRRSNYATPSLQARPIVQPSVMQPQQPLPYVPGLLANAAQNPAIQQQIPPFSERAPPSMPQNQDGEQMQQLLSLIGVLKNSGQTTSQQQISPMDPRMFTTSVSSQAAGNASMHGGVFNARSSEGQSGLTGGQSELLGTLLKYAQNQQAQGPNSLMGNRTHY